MVTNATPSIKSEVKNLSSLDPSLHYNDVAMAISEEYSKAYTARQRPHLHVIDPSDNQQFPGIDNFANELKSWQWLFGKTPKFELPLSIKLSTGDTKMVFK
ncbi:lipoyltransferase 1, mitochondrial, partial [Exaiptasia diaphana]|uniref:Uncharacterized protein n=1 Tax=Exaiptasia diaphana TaxID=2652724 RepID=A0A913YJZ8_EXADI